MQNQHGAHKGQKRFRCKIKIVTFYSNSRKVVTGYTTWYQARAGVSQVDNKKVEGRPKHGVKLSG